MEIIKNAFDEGRETSTPWDKSKAKHNENALNLALENLSIMKKKEKMALIPLHQIDPKTHKILKTFPSRLAAARYICVEILKRPEKNPIAVTGNMEICMRAGWKAYGFYWKLATQKSIKENLSKAPGGSKAIYVLVNGTPCVYSSINEVARVYDVPPKRIAKYSKPHAGRYAINVTTSGRIRNFTFQEYNPDIRTKYFKDIKEAASYNNVSVYTMERMLKRNLMINNTICKIKT